MSNKLLTAKDELVLENTEAWQEEITDQKLIEEIVKIKKVSLLGVIVLIGAVILGCEKEASSTGAASTASKQNQTQEIVEPEREPKQPPEDPEKRARRLLNEGLILLERAKKLNQSRWDTSFREVEEEKLEEELRLLSEAFEKITAATKFTSSSSCTKAIEILPDTEHKKNELKKMLKIRREEKRLNKNWKLFFDGKIHAPSGYYPYLYYKNPTPHDIHLEIDFTYKNSSGSEESYGGIFFSYGNSPKKYKSVLKGSIFDGEVTDFKVTSVKIEIKKWGEKKQ